LCEFKSRRGLQYLEARIEDRRSNIDDGCSILNLRSSTFDTTGV
jgi:hypothetical protein